MDENKPKSADVWRKRIVGWQSSGQSVRGWCKEHGCHEHAFYRWRAELGLSPVRRVVKPMRFAEVMVERPATEPIRLRLGGGRELVLPIATPISDVAALVRLVEGLS